MKQENFLSYVKVLIGRMLILQLYQWDEVSKDLKKGNVVSALKKGNENDEDY